MIRKSHFVGEGPNPGENEPSPSYETSLAVSQWVELVRGERTRQDPANSFRVLEIKAEKHVCLGCFGVRTFDVIYAETTVKPIVNWLFATEGPFKIKVCRCCRREVVS